MYIRVLRSSSTTPEHPIRRMHSQVCVMSYRRPRSIPHCRSPPLHGQQVCNSSRPARRYANRHETRVSSAREGLQKRVERRAIGRLLRADVLEVQLLARSDTQCTQAFRHCSVTAGRLHVRHRLHPLSLRRERVTCSTSYQLGCPRRSTACMRSPTRTCALGMVMVWIVPTPPSPPRFA
jgi:hypothetical protein